MQYFKDTLRSSIEEEKKENQSYSFGEKDLFS